MIKQEKVGCVCVWIEVYIVFTYDPIFRLLFTIIIIVYYFMRTMEYVKKRVWRLFSYQCGI